MLKLYIRERKNKEKKLKCSFSQNNLKHFFRNNTSFLNYLICFLGVEGRRWGSGCLISGSSARSKQKVGTFHLPHYYHDFFSLLKYEIIFISNVWNWFSIFFNSFFVSEETAANSKVLTCLKKSGRLWRTSIKSRGFKKGG